MEAREYLRLFRRRWWLIASIALIGAAFAWLTAPAAVAPEVQRFRAEHRLIVEPMARQFTPENPETIALLATSGEVPDRVAQRLPGEGGADALLGRIEIIGDGELGVITVAATTDDEERAAAIADAFAEELVAFLDEQERASRARELADLEAEIEELRDELATLSTRITNGDGDVDLLEEQRLVLLSRYGDVEASYQALAGEAAPTSGLRSLGPARPGEIDAGIQAPRGRAERAAILGMIGLLVGIAAVVALDRLDVRIKSKEDAEAAFRIPVIAEIPVLPITRRRRREVLSHLEPTSSVAEAYRALRTTLLLVEPRPLTPPVVDLAYPHRRATDVAPARNDEAPSSEPRVYVVTSSRPSEGKTTTAMNLAAVFAEAGRSVIVVGADIRRPEAHLYAGVARAPGLTEVLRGAVPRLTDVIVPTSIPGVRMVPGGSHVSNPAELLLQGPDVIAELRPMADVIVLDCAPMLSVNDANQLLPAADAVVVACRAGRATGEAAKRVQEILARLRVPVAGIVLVGAHATPGTGSYYYGYHDHASASTVHRLRRRDFRGLLRRSDPDVPAAPSPPLAPRPPATGPTAEPATEPAPVPSAPSVGAEAPSTTEVVAPRRAESTNGSKAGTTTATDPNPWAWP